MPDQSLSDQSTTPMPRKNRRLIRLVVMLLIVWSAAAYFLLPIAWRLATRHHPAVEGMPRITVTGNGIPGDSLNISLVGTEEEVDAAMLAAGWFPADPLTLKSSLRIAAGTVLRRSYDTAPVSSLYVWGRKQDLAFEQPVGDDPRRRHHVRFWKSEKVDENGRPLWAGAATFDTSVGFSHTTGQITHHIDGNVDAERDKLLGDLQHAKVVAQVDWLVGFHEKLEGRNGGGDLWHTDGRAPVVYLVPDRDESRVVEEKPSLNSAERGE
ncbi:MAG: LssY C-terminal domain-containing protein [Planctomycetota bacterium]